MHQHRMLTVDPQVPHILLFRRFLCLFIHFLKKTCKNSTENRENGTHIGFFFKKMDKIYKKQTKKKHFEENLTETQHFLCFLVICNNSVRFLIIKIHILNDSTVKTGKSLKNRENKTNFEPFQEIWKKKTTENDNYISFLTFWYD